MDCCKLSNLLSHRHNTHVTQTCFSCNIRHITHATQACSSCHIDMQRWLYLCHILGVEFIFPLLSFVGHFLKIFCLSDLSGQKYSQNKIILRAVLSLQQCFTFELDGSGWGLKTLIIVSGSSHHISMMVKKKVCIFAGRHGKGPRIHRHCVENF